ncbi:hypothetical protein [Pseudomonas sp. LB3P31]
MFSTLKFQADMGMLLMLLFIMEHDWHAGTDAGVGLGIGFLQGRGSKKERVTQPFTQVGRIARIRNLLAGCCLSRRVISAVLYSTKIGRPRLAFSVGKLTGGDLLARTRARICPKIIKPGQVTDLLGTKETAEKSSGEGVAMEYVCTLKYQLATGGHDVGSTVKRLGEAGCDDALIGVVNRRTRLRSGALSIVRMSSSLSSAESGHRATRRGIQPLWSSKEQRLIMGSTLNGHGLSLFGNERAAGEGFGLH